MSWDPYIRREAMWEYLRGSLWALPTVSVVLALAWAVANPPFAAPDEASHFVRALGVGQGHLIGEQPPATLKVGGTPRQQQWVRQ